MCLKNNAYFFLFLGLKDLRFCTRLLDEINYSCDGSSVVQNEAGEVFGLEKVALDHVESVTVEHENQVQVSINKVMSYLKHVFPAARKVALTNCIACEVKMNCLFSIYIIALSFCKSQKCFGLVQIFCARPNIELHLVPLQKI